MVAGQAVGENSEIQQGKLFLPAKNSCAESPETRAIDSSPYPSSYGDDQRTGHYPVHTRSVAHPRAGIGIPEQGSPNPSHSEAWQTLSIFDVLTDVFPKY
jgi:hypothetical protein